MPRFTLRVNDDDHEVEAPDDMPLLRVLRDLIGLSGESARAVRRVWIAEDIPQCGYRQPGPT